MANIFMSGNIFHDSASFFGRMPEVKTSVVVTKRISADDSRMEYVAVCESMSAARRFLHNTYGHKNMELLRKALEYPGGENSVEEYRIKTNEGPKIFVISKELSRRSTTRP